MSSMMQFLFNAIRNLQQPAVSIYLRGKYFNSGRHHNLIVYFCVLCSVHLHASGTSRSYMAS